MGEAHHPAKFPWYAPRIWHGMTFRVWWSLLRDYRFSISPTRIPLAAGVTAVSVGNSIGRWINDWSYRHRVAEVQIEAPPIFVLGHWRTGTTLLHELLALDPRHNAPNTYQCMQPHHFLLSEPILKPCVKLLMPRRRPMDDMPVSLDLPQEDEFALAILGAPSLYTDWAFPNQPCQQDRSLELVDLSRDELRRWKRSFRWFLRCLTFRDSRRLVIKSPPHTARVKVLLDMFPDAKFVHLVRDPMKVVPSTILMWRRLQRVLGLHTRLPDKEPFEDHVLDLFVRMHDAFEAQRDLVPAGNLCEIQFGDFVSHPLETMEQLYNALSLGDLADARPLMNDHLKSRQSHRKNAHAISDSLREKIRIRCRRYSECYGFMADEQTSDPTAMNHEATMHEP